MQNILVFGGCKQAGKSSAAKYVVGSQLKKNGVIREFEIDDQGNLLVNTFYEQDGKMMEGKGILDIYRTDFDFMKYASERIWPYCKVYSFASLLKESAIAIFGLNPKNIYGSDDDKNQPTDIIKNGKNLTYRELLQEYGTVCREFKPDCWVSACYAQIVAEGYPNVIIDDCRYENEVDFGIKSNAKTILLTKKPFEDTHMSEKIHEVSRDKFNFVIDNEKMTLQEKNIEIDKILQAAGWQTGLMN